MGRSGEFLRRVSARADGVREAFGALRERAVETALAPYLEQVERLKWRLTRLDGRVSYALLGAPRRDDATAREVSHALLASRTRLAGGPARQPPQDATPELIAHRLRTLQDRGWPAPARLRRVLLLGAHPEDVPLLHGCWPAGSVTLVDGEALEAPPAAVGLEVVASDPVTALLARSGSSFDAVVALDVYQRLSPWERQAFLDLAWACVGEGGALYAEVPNTANLEVLSDRYWRDPRHLLPVSPTAIREALERLPGAQVCQVGTWEGEQLVPWAGTTPPGRGTRLFALARRG